MDGRSDVRLGLRGRGGRPLGFQVRIGYHPGVRDLRAAAAAAATAATAAAGRAGRTCSREGRCNPCTVEVGKASTVTADATSSIGCTVTYSWSAPDRHVDEPHRAEHAVDGADAGRPRAGDGDGDLPAGRQDRERHGQHPGRAAGGEARSCSRTCTSTSTATRCGRKRRARSTKRSRRCSRTPTLGIEIEGHTCNIGTAEYNLALGERRANAVRDYLTSRGIGADRLRTVSYGEERPKHDNAREETRRLNRRAALVVICSGSRNVALRWTASARELPRPSWRRSCRPEEASHAVRQHLSRRLLPAGHRRAGGAVVRRRAAAHLAGVGRHRPRHRGRPRDHAVGVRRQAGDHRERMTAPLSDREPATVSGKTISGCLHSMCLPCRATLPSLIRCPAVLRPARAVAACKEEQAGVEVKDLSLQRQQGRHDRPAEVGPRDRRELEAALGRRSTTSAASSSKPI